MVREAHSNLDKGEYETMCSQLAQFVVRAWSRKRLTHITMYAHASLGSGCLALLMQAVRVSAEKISDITLDLIDDNSAALVSVVEAALVLKSSLRKLTIRGGDAVATGFPVSQLLEECQNLQIKLQYQARPAILCVVSKFAKNQGGLNAYSTYQCQSKGPTLYLQKARGLH